jgi:hypothetical protein
MKKMSTLFKVIYHESKGKGTITTEVRPENSWVYADKGVVPTRKFDGTACMVKAGVLYARYDAKPTKEAWDRVKSEGGSYAANDFRGVPATALPCQEPDLVTGHYPHWVICEKDNPAFKHHLAAFNKQEGLEDGTYEFCGKTVKSDPEGVGEGVLISHGSKVLPLTDFSFEGIKAYLANPAHNVEGIVFRHPDGRMCKIRKADFGVRR